MRNSWVRRVAIVGAAGLTSGLIAFGVATSGGGPTPGSPNDPGCIALGGNDGSGTCVVAGAVTPPAGGVSVGESVHLLSGAHINLQNALSLSVVSGSLEMDKNSSIDGKGKAISINVPTGDVTMHGTAGTGPCGYPSVPNNSLGAQITSINATVTTVVTLNIGDINASPPTGALTMERCSLVNVSTGSAPAGQVVVNAGHNVDVEGIIISESSLTGTGINQAPGGGSISVRTSCNLTVGATGVVSSKGRDPGADLVHLEGCDVHIDGLVQSTGSGHVTPSNPPTHCRVHPHQPLTDTGCIEVWGQDITVSATGEVNADINAPGTGGPQGTSYIDLFADRNLSVTGKIGATDKFAVHANSNSGSDTTPNTVTALAHTGSLTATGRAFSAADTGAGSYGGTVDLEARGKVNLDGANIQAGGHNGSSPNPPCGGGSGNCGGGGHINVRSWHNAVSWRFGVGYVRPDFPGSPRSGTVALSACTSNAIGGTDFGPNSQTAVTQTITGPNNCDPGPALPTYVEDAFGGPSGDRVIWGHCPKPICPGDVITADSENGTVSSGEVHAVITYVSGPSCKQYIEFSASSDDDNSQSLKSITFLSDQLADAHMTAVFDWGNFPECRADGSTFPPNVPPCPTTLVQVGSGTFNPGVYCIAATVAVPWCITGRNVTYLPDPDGSGIVAHIVETWDGLGDVAWRH